ncbi:MAG: hypothetical protein ACFFCS_15935 [Candidatus Hodarchaeota archaeon]
MIWDPMERLLWGLAIATLFTCGFLYLNSANKRDDLKERRVMRGFAGIFIGVAISKIFHYFKDLQVPWTFVNPAFFGDFDDAGLSFFFLERLAVFFYHAGIMIFIFSFEFNNRQTRFLLTIIHGVIISSFFFLPPSLYEPMNISSFFYGGIILFVIFYYSSRTARLEYKTIISFLITSEVLIGYGYVYSGKVAKILSLAPLYLSPLLLFLGSVVAMIPMRVDILSFKKVSRYRMIINILMAVYIIISILQLIIVEAPIIYIITTGIFTTFMIIAQTGTVRPETSKESELAFLGMFNKPQKLTEEEISVSKEKQICLVCKGEISRENYVCPNCKAFYCERCTNALKDLENACWSCNTPFDPTKPVKIKPLEEIKAELADEVVTDDLKAKKEVKT